MGEVVNMVTKEQKTIMENLEGRVNPVSIFCAIGGIKDLERGMETVHTLMERGHVSRVSIGNLPHYILTYRGRESMRGGVYNAS